MKCLGRVNNSVRLGSRRVWQPPPSECSAGRGCASGLPRQRSPSPRCHAAFCHSYGWASVLPTAGERAQVPTPGVGPHWGLMNCGPPPPWPYDCAGSWGLEFSENRCGFPFPTPGWRPSHRLLFGGQEERRLEEGRKSVREAEVEPRRGRGGRRLGEKGPGKSVGL